MKDYKKILEGVVNIISTTEKSDIGFANICTYIGENCPELKESEDERIRKALLELVHDTTGDELWVDYNVHKEEALDWLEKQGTPKKVSIWKHWKDGIAGNGEGKPIFLVKNGYTYSLSSCLGYECDYIELSELDKLMLEKQERKPFDYEHANIQQKDFAPKVEPKFKVGDWVVLSTADGEKVVQIDSIEYFKSGEPRYITSEGRWFGNGTKSHLWTIQDAKDGDVLHCWIDGDEFILIYKGIKDGYITTYGHLYQKFKSFAEEPTTMFCRTIQGHFTPATKEQRDLLFAKMKEAGYEWDAEKKEPKKVSQRMISAEAKEALYCKPAWSEEDEKTLNEIFSVAARACLRKNTLFGKSYDYIKWQKWLKSLKDRYTWKPSDEQIGVIEAVINNRSFQRRHLDSLYEQLKKL